MLGKLDLGHEASGAPAHKAAQLSGHETRVMKTLRPLRSRVNIGVPDDNNRLEFQVKARKARSPSPKDALYRGEGVTLVHPAKGVLNLPPFYFRDYHVFVSCVLFGSLQVPPGSSGATSCAPRSLTSSQWTSSTRCTLKADLTDCHCECRCGQPRTTRTRPGVRVHYSSLGERGAGPWGPASPPGKGAVDDRGSRRPS